MHTATTIAPFRNEAFTDFSDAKSAAAFQKALDFVKSQLGRRHPNVIGGKRYEMPEMLVSLDPTDPDVVIGTFPSSGAAEADRAVAAASEAFPAWSALTFEDRASRVFRLAGILKRDRHVLSAWMVREAGKSCSMSVVVVTIRSSEGTMPAL